MSGVTIDGGRLLREILELGEIGRNSNGELSRTAFSNNDLVGRMWFEGRAKHGGFDYRMDGVGNQSAILCSDNPDAQTVLVGSHLDTVANGGKYDGALGVLVGLACLRALRDVSLPFHLEVVNLSDEEGAILPMLGSLGMTGQLSMAHLKPRGGGAALDDGLQRLGLSLDTALNARRDLSKIRAFLEVHIEQGTRLEDAGIDIGIVSSIVGVRSAWLRFHGTAAHAGTQPMAQRNDALDKFCDFLPRAKRLVRERFHPGVMNCGLVTVANGAFNIVPGAADVSLEFRHGNETILQEMEEALFGLVHEVAPAATISVATRIPAAACDPALGRTMAAACDKFSLSHTPLLSFAGHDTQTMARVVPSALFFVPCRGGISHNSAEFADERAVVNAARVMLETVLGLANK